MHEEISVGKRKRARTQKESHSVTWMSTQGEHYAKQAWKCRLCALRGYIGTIMPG